MQQQRTSHVRTHTLSLFDIRTHATHTYKLYAQAQVRECNLEIKHRDEENAALKDGSLRLHKELDLLRAQMIENDRQHEEEVVRLRTGRQSSETQHSEYKNRLVFLVGRKWQKRRKFVDICMCMCAWVCVLESECVYVLVYVMRIAMAYIFLYICIIYGRI